MRFPRSGLLAVLVFGAALLTANVAKADEVFYYRGPHAVPSSYGGFCHISVRHFHSYKPEDPKVFRYDDSTYIFIGDPTAHGWTGDRIPFYGHHPIPGGWGGGWCYIGGPHYHFYRPYGTVPYRFHGGVYYYSGAFTDPWYISHRHIYEPVFASYYVSRPGYIRPVIYTAPPRFYVGPRVVVNVAPWRGPTVRVGVGGPGFRGGVGVRPPMGGVGVRPPMGGGVRPPMGGPGHVGGPVGGPRPPMGGPGHVGGPVGGPRPPMGGPGHVGSPGAGPRPPMGGPGPRGGVTSPPPRVGGPAVGHVPGPGTRTPPRIGGAAPGHAPSPGVHTPPRLTGPTPGHAPGPGVRTPPRVAPSPGGIRGGGPTAPPAINKGMRPTSPRPVPVKPAGPSRRP